MQEQLVCKIGDLLATGIKSEADAVYLLVQVRKLMERQKSGGRKYDSLKLYSDWAVHVKLSGPRAQDIVKHADGFYPGFMSRTLSPGAVMEGSKIYVFGTFREELDHFLEEHIGLGFSESEWHSFLRYFLRVIEECPLALESNDKSLTEIDEIVILVMEDAAYENDESNPIVWVPFFRGQMKPPTGSNFCITKKFVDRLKAYKEVRDRESAASQIP
jgi:hypothetical protein